MKLDEIINGRNYSENKEWEFRKQLQDFIKDPASTNRIDSYGNMVIVTEENTVDWTKNHHDQLCREFGLKLVKVEKRYWWIHEGYCLKVFWYYASETDTNFKKLDFERVRL